MRVLINSEEKDVPEGLTVAELLAHLNLPADRVAIERNLDILTRARWSDTAVRPGDRYEIVQLVGGG